MRNYFVCAAFSAALLSGCGGSGGGSNIATVPQQAKQPIGNRSAMYTVPGPIPTINPALHNAVPAFHLTQMYSRPGYVYQGITTGPDNNMWFADEAGIGIGPISTTGTVGTAYNTPAARAGGQSGIQAIIAGPDGNLWFNEQLAGKVARLTTAGVLTEWNLSICHGAAVPLGMVVGPDGNIWIANYGNNSIDQITTYGSLQRFPTTGNLAANAGVFGIANGPDGNIWFTETNAGQIGVMSPSGQLLHEYSMPTAQGGPLNGPASIVAGPDGNMWVAEWPCSGARTGGCTNHAGRLIRVSISGSFTVTTYNSGGGGLGAIAVGPDSNIWVTNYDASGVGAFNPTSMTTVGGVAVALGVWGIAAGPDGNMWVVSGGSTDAVWRIGTGM